ncbi:MAG: DNA internalization-related competence protein ComEC/Rec2 [Longimicrobiaceae bacterium]
MNLLLLPLVAALLAFLTGLLPALRFAPPPLPFAGLSILLLLVAAFLTRSETYANRERLLRGVVLLAIGAAGAGLGAGAARVAADDCRALLPDRARITVHGTLAANSLQGAQLPGGGAPLLPLLAREVLTDAGAVPGCSGPIRVRLPAEAPGAAAGAELRLSGEWGRFNRPGLHSQWPRDPRFAGLLVVDSVVLLAPPRLGAHPLLTLRGRAEAHLHWLFPRHAPLAEALLLGRRELMDPALRERFARAGLAHLLAISGMHVGLIAGSLMLLGSIFRVPRRRRAWITIGCVALYLAVIGAPTSAARAGLMISLVLAGVLLQRPSASLPLIAAAALAILAHRPLAVLEPGFQLSFAGVIGILLVRRPVLRLLPRDWLHAGWKRAPIEMLTVSAAAFLATAPVAAYHFGLVAPIAILANLPAIPLMSLALIGVGAAAVAGLVSAPLGRLLADGAGLMLDLLDGVATLAARVPFGHAEVHLPRGWMWAAGAVALLLGFHLAARMRAAVRWTVATGSAAAVLLAWPAVAADRGGALEIYFLDVGQGDATAVRTPQNRWILVDAGPRSDSYDAGERRILPFLRSHGVRRIDAVILTHPHADHIGGMPALLRSVEVGRVIEPGYVVGNPLYLETLRLVEEREVAWSAARPGRTLQIDGVTLELLWPDAELLDRVTDANEISAVTLLRYGELSVLLTGDAYAETEHELVARHGERLRAQILKAGHHGSRTSTSERLLDAVRPELVVISAGRRNRYGHPAPEVLARLAERGIEVARTDLEGTISIRLSPAENRRWRRLDRR